jgi:CheY-like chemotaxis protein
MRLLIIGDRLETATSLGKLLQTLGHAPCVATEADASDRSPSIASLVSALAPDAILLDLPDATPVAAALVSNLQVDRRTRAVPTVLLAQASDAHENGPW